MQAAKTSARTSPWWVRPGLEVRDGRLRIAGRDAEHVARRHGTPLFVYDLTWIGEQARALQRALARAGLDHRVRLALKAQRAPQVLGFIRALGPPEGAEAIGIDASSPGEVLHALAHGWSPREISFTGTNVSERDLDVLLSQPIHINVDLLSQLERLGRRASGRTVGIRVNPGIGVGRGHRDDTLYAGRRPTKFGILREQLPDALEIARRHRLEIDTVHFHVGDGFLTSGLSRFEEAVARVAAMAMELRDAGCPITEVNTGGGLGVPEHEGDRPLDLDAHADVLARHLGPLGVAVGVEPGDFLVKESAIFLTEVVTVEDRAETRFVGVDSGWNILNERFIYHIPQRIVLCHRADEAAARRVTVAGNINEGNDLFAEDEPLPPVEEGDLLAILSCGAYAQSMEIVHCLRPPARAVFFTDRI
jgi:diaminopimelate decarboxylase